MYTNIFIVAFTPLNYVSNQNDVSKLLQMYLGINNYFY